MAQQKKKKLIPVTDILAPSSNKKDIQISRDDTVSYEIPHDHTAEVYDLKLEALRDFGKARPLPTDNFDFNENQTSDQKKTNDKFSKEFSNIARPSVRVRSSRRMWWWVVGVAVVVVFAYIVIAVLPRVTVAITAKKLSTTTTQKITITDSIGGASDNQVSGEVITERKTNVFTFPATGIQSGLAKARGTIIIFNAYSTAPQTLIATTRFETPDGKIFRLNKRVVVPGGKKTGQVFEPGSVEAEVTADQAGPEYNIDPVDHLTIPGFKGSDKYEKFYATSLQPMSGGSNSEIPVATEQDIVSAKQSAQTRMKESIMSTIALKIPNGFTFIKDTQTFSIRTEKVDTRVDENKNFTIAIEAESSALAFKESDLRALLQSAARKEGNVPTPYIEKEGVITYATTTSDWVNHTIKAEVSYQGTFWNPIDVSQLTKDIAGKNEDDLKSTILSLEGIDRLTVSFWPFWVSRVPNNSEKIEITIE
jgi:hypothetical protein